MSVLRHWLPLVCLAASLAPSATWAQELDTDLWSRLLRRYTVATDDIASTRVDYRALRNSSEWRLFVRSLGAVRPEALASTPERLAFWINAYNILAIELVTANYPVSSIKKLGIPFLSPVWDKPAGTIGGRTYSLGEIEHEILRPLGEPRIHAAIVCASLSCPPLLREAFTGAELDAQLDEQMRAFVGNSRKGLRLDRDARTLWLSQVFKWFEDDFGGRASLLRTLARYLPQEDADWLSANVEDVRVRYFDYDWSLNEKR
jgi:hypothetical protein